MNASFVLKRVFLVILALLPPAALILLGSNRINTPSVYYSAELSDGWEIYGLGEENYSATPYVSGISLNRKGDTITIRRVLPTEDEMRSSKEGYSGMKRLISPCIMFTTALAKVVVSVDGTELYRYGQDIDSRGYMVPKHVHFIPLNSTDPGSKLSITITATENNAFNTLPRVYFGNREDLRRNFIQETRLSLFVGTFLSVFAVILLILSSYLYVYHDRDLSLLFSAAISFVTGIYILCYNNIFNYFTDNDSFFTAAEYMALYLTPLSLTLFISVDQHELLKERSARIRLLGSVFVNACFPLIVLAFHLGNIIHLSRFLPILHTMCGLEFLVLVPMLAKVFIGRIKNFRQITAEEKDSTAALSSYTRFMSANSLLTGILIFMFCALMDIMKYNVIKYISKGSSGPSNINFTIFGSLCFLLCLLINYFFHSVADLYAGSEKKRLEGLAYTDQLTGLSNRARCEELLSAMTGDYTVISVDMDHLKHINDNFGHEEGDRLLIAFAGLLSKVFSDAKLLGRTGGDEFTAAFMGINKELCEERLAELQDDIDRFNEEKKLPFRMSASWGYATSNERRRAGDGPIDVYKLADARMYLMKEEHHDKRLKRILADIHAGGRVNAFTSDGTGKAD